MDIPISVLMISTSYPKTIMDWQGLFIRHLSDSLGARSDIRLSLWAPSGKRVDSVKNACAPQESVWLDNLMMQGGIAHILRKRSLGSIATPLKLLWLLRNAYQRHQNEDVLHINWLQNALPLSLLSGKQAALVSVLGSDMGMLRLPGMRLALRRIFRNRRCILAPNADWMVPVLLEYFGDLTEVRYIPFGIAHQWFELKRDWRAAPCKWLVVSRLTQDKIGPLFDWGKSCFRNGHELHLLGPMQEHLNIPEWVHYHGPTHPQDLMDNWFPQAAGLISLSHHNEGRPQVMLEAMAAGLPIIATHLPAHDNLLRHRDTGWLVDSREDFVEALGWLSELEHNEEMGSHASAWAKQYIGTWDDCAQRYVAAYQALLETTP